MKRVALAVCGWMIFGMAAVALAGGEANVPDQAYFDSRFNKLQKSVSEVKGDTSQIVSILGTVFEGTVPSGGTLTSLCNANGWNMVVLMGHNNISNPDNVAADAKFLYPKTADEFQAALTTGKPLYDAWLKTKKIAFKVDRIKVDTIDIDKLNVRVARVSEELSIKKMEIDRLKIREAEITEALRIKKMEIEDLRIKNATIDHLKIRLAEIDELRIRQLAVKDACIAELRNRPVVIQKRVVYKSLNGSAYAPPSSMRIIQAGDVCDERTFTGMVPNGALAATGGKSVDVFELHRRSNKNMEYKVKRLHVDSNGTAYPMVWSDGSCMRKYSDASLTEADLRTLLSTNESLRSTTISEIGAKNYGANLTEGVYIIYTKQ